MKNCCWFVAWGEDDHEKLLLICSLCSKHFCTSLLFRFFCSCCNFHVITRLETLATQANWFVKYITYIHTLFSSSDHYYIHISFTSTTDECLVREDSLNYTLHFLFTVLTLQLVYTKQCKITLILDDNQQPNKRAWVSMERTSTAWNLLVLIYL